MSRYRLHQHGPDDSSTYAECAGHDAGLGPIVAEADRLADLVPTADGMGHSNWSVRDRHRRESIHPNEFWGRKCVQKATNVPAED